MDILRRKKPQLPEPGSVQTTTPAPGTLSASSSSTKLHPKVQTDMAAAAIASTNSPASSVDSGKSSFFQTYIPRAMRSLSRGSNTSIRTANSVPESTPDSTSPQQTSTSQFPRNKVLQKNHHKRVSSSGHEFLSRRASSGSDLFSSSRNRVSRASTIMSSSSSGGSVDWRTQSVEKHASVDFTDAPITRMNSQNRAGYLVMTADFILIFRNRNDAVAAFPSVAESATATSPTTTTTSSSFSSSKPSMLPPSEPLHAIPLRAVLSVFRTDSTYPPFGIEIWWKHAYPVIATGCAHISFHNHRDRELHLENLVSMVKGRNRDRPETARACYEVEECIRKVFRAEESSYMSSVPEIFPVVYRNAPERLPRKKSEEKKKGQPEGHSSYFLVIGINMCFFVEIGPASVLQTTALEVRYQTCGLVTLELFRADWTPRDERFSMRFRDPFKNPIGLELASRLYRHIILTLTKADKFLKPAWPTHWQTHEIFHVAGLPTPQHIVAGEDFGGFQRTLTAFCAGYRCDPITWEINWRCDFAPEFRVVQRPDGKVYTDLQLLACLRALRYNDYFKSLSFRDVDLSSLLDKYDSSRKSNVAYINKNGVCLTNHETSLVQKASILHQEIHALAFSGKLRQIDFSNSLRVVYRGNDSQHSVQFLVPILNLLAAGLTRCNCILLSGCSLGDTDIDCLVGFLSPTAGEQSDDRVVPSQDAVGLEALDVSHCSLSDATMKTLFRALSQSAGTLRMLDVSHNFGRVSAPMVQTFMECVGSLRHLNLASSLTGTFDGELLPFEVLDRLELLEDLDISNFKLNNDSLDALERFFRNLSVRQSQNNEEQNQQNQQNQLGQPGQPGQQGGCSLRRVVLNNCGINGQGAARIFSAMVGLYDVHLHLNSNPLEDGIEDFVEALNACWGGRFGLHMDMVEFLDEDNYVALINALTSNWYIDYLSLAGTAPTPTGEDACGEDTCAALERFFAENQSVRYLDLSGFCGKLDDGQLGKGFGKAFRGLADNRTLTHLRVRNQNLHDTVGELGAAIQANAALLYLDCGDNGFNLTSLKFLARSLQSNITIVSFPFTAEDVDQVLKDCLKDMPSALVAAPTKHKKKPAVDTAAEKQKALLLEEIEATVYSEIQSYMVRNKDLVEQETGWVVDMEPANDTCGTHGWPSLQLRMPDGIEFPSYIHGQMEISVPEGDEAADEEGGGGGVGGGVGSSTLMALEETEEMPYRVPEDHEALQSPLEPKGSWEGEKEEESAKEVGMEAGKESGIGNGIGNGIGTGNGTGNGTASGTANPAGGMLESPVMDGTFLDDTLFSEPDLARILEKFSMDDGTKYVVCGQT